MLCKDDTVTKGLTNIRHYGIQGYSWTLAGCEEGTVSWRSYDWQYFGYVYNTRFL